MWILGDWDVAAFQGHSAAIAFFSGFQLVAVIVMLNLLIAVRVYCTSPTLLWNPNPDPAPHYYTPFVGPATRLVCALSRTCREVCSATRRISPSFVSMRPYLPPRPSTSIDTGGPVQIMTDSYERMREQQRVQTRIVIAQMVHDLETMVRPLRPPPPAFRPPSTLAAPCMIQLYSSIYTAGPSFTILYHTCLVLTRVCSSSRVGL